MKPIFRSAIPVIDPKGNALEIRIEIEPPVETGEEAWCTVARVDGVPHGTGSYMGHDPMVSVCSALRSIRRSIHEEMAYGYTAACAPIHEHIEEYFVWPESLKDCHWFENCEVQVEDLPLRDPVQDEKDLGLICTILNSAPGVEQGRAYRAGPNKVTIQFSVDSFAMLNLILECAMMTNEAVVAETLCSSRVALDPTKGCFCIRIEEEWRSVDCPTQSKVFALFLAKDLCDAGHLSREFITDLHKQWLDDDE